MKSDSLVSLISLMMFSLAADGLGVLPGPYDFSSISEGHAYLEGPSWNSDSGFLMFTDQNANRLYKWAPETGSILLRQYDGKVNGTTWDTQGRLLLCESASRRINRITLEGDSLTDDILVAGLPNEPNDIVVHSNGSIWFTTPYWGNDQTRLSQQHVYRYIPETDTLEIVYTSTGKPNGLAFSPDESVLYVALYQASRIVKIHIEENGNPTGLVSEFTRAIQQNPDGVKVDDKGYLYVIASQMEEEGILIFDSTSKKVGLIRIPETDAPPTNLVFSEDYLYVTAGTSVVRTPWSGVPEAPHGQALYTGNPIVVDGLVDPVWIWTPAFNLKHPIRLYDMLNVFDLVPDPEDLSAEVRVLWDTDNLYLLAWITDDTPQEPYSGVWFRDDIFEVYLDIDLLAAERSGFYDGLNDWELGFPSLANPVSIVTGDNSVKDTAGMQAASALTGSGYLMEIALPWSTLGADSPMVAGTIIGADFHVVDNDNNLAKREHKLAWAGWDDNAWQNTTLLGQVVLEGWDVVNYWPSSWLFFAPSGDGSTWVHGDRHPGDWMWMSLSFYPWIYHFESSWSYLHPVYEGYPWAWSLSGPIPYQWVLWN